jgi:hypothetical protein
MTDNRQKRLVRRKKLLEHGFPTQEPKTLDEWARKYDMPPPYRPGGRNEYYDIDAQLSWLETRRVVA